VASFFQSMLGIRKKQQLFRFSLRNIYFLNGGLRKVVVIFFQCV
jgi:hypothetical protein